MPVRMVVTVTGIPVMMMGVTLIGGVDVRVERRLDACHAGPERFEQRRQIVVCRHPQRALTDLDRHMTVAETIGDARERRARLTLDVQQALGLGEHPDHASVGGGEQISAAQHLPARQHDRHLFSGCESRAQTAAAAQIEAELELPVRCAPGGLRGGQFAADLDHASGPT